MKTIQEKIVIGAGLWLILLPFTGFPSSWKMILAAVMGLVLVYVGALLFKKAREQHAGNGEKKTETFTETA